MLIASEMKNKTISPAAVVLFNILLPVICLSVRQRHVSVNIVRWSARSRAQFVLLTTPVRLLVSVSPPCCYLACGLIDKVKPEFF
jgi:hypothetical protein